MMKTQSKILAALMLFATPAFAATPPDEKDQVAQYETPDTILDLAPDPDSFDSFHALSPERTKAFLDFAKANHKNVAVGIETIWVGRWSGNPDLVLTFAFNKDSCLVDRGSIPLAQWRGLFVGDQM
jgi:hypothetical protein